MQNVSEPLLSIVIPFYNAERYFEQRLNCLLKQSFTNFDIVLVDDGSTDSSPILAKEFQKLHPDKIIYVQQDNKGPGAARNTGLKHAKGKYVMFADADDFCSLTSLERLISHLENYSDIDFLMFHPILFNSSNSNYYNWYDEWLFEKMGLPEGKVFNPNDFPLLYETEANICRYVFKKEFLDNIHFKFLKNVKWEDLPAHFYLLHSAKKAVFVRCDGAFYYRSNYHGQITSETGKSRLDMRIVFKEIQSYFGNNSWSKKSKVFMLGYLSNFTYWSLDVIDDKYRNEFVEICHSFYKNISFKLYLSFFFKAKDCLRNKIMIFYLRSKKRYVVLKDRNLIKRKIRVFNKIKRIFGK